MKSNSKFSASFSTAPSGSSFSSSSGFFPIRAPLTLDDDDDDDEAQSDSSSAGHKLDTLSSNSSFVIHPDEETIEESYDVDEYELSRPFVGDPDEEIIEESYDVDEYELSRPFVGDPDEEIIEKSCNVEEYEISRTFVGDLEEKRLKISFEDEEKSSEIDEFDRLVEHGAAENPNWRQPVMPVARLSMDDDFDEDEVMSELEDNVLSDVVRIPSVVELENIAGASGIMALGAKEQDETELVSEMKVVECSISDKFLEVREADSGTGVEGVTVAQDETISVELVGYKGFGAVEEELEVDSDSLAVKEADVMEQNPKPEVAVKYVCEENILNVVKLNDNVPLIVYSKRQMESNIEVQEDNTVFKEMPVIPCEIDTESSGSEDLTATEFLDQDPALTQQLKRIPPTPSHTDLTNQHLMGSFAETTMETIANVGIEESMVCENTKSTGLNASQRIPLVRGSYYYKLESGSEREIDSGTLCNSAQVKSLDEAKFVKINAVLEPRHIQRTIYVQSGEFSETAESESLKDKPYSDSAFSESVLQSPNLLYDVAREVEDEADHDLVITEEGLTSDGDGNDMIRESSEAEVLEPNHIQGTMYVQSGEFSETAESESLKDKPYSDSAFPESILQSPKLLHDVTREVEDEADHDLVITEDGLTSDGDGNDMIRESSEASEQIMNELEHKLNSIFPLDVVSSKDHSHRIEGRSVIDSHGESVTDRHSKGMDLLDFVAENSKFSTDSSLDHLAGVHFVLSSWNPASKHHLSDAEIRAGNETEDKLNGDEKKLEKMQSIRVTFFRLVKKLGLSPQDSIIAKILKNLALTAQTHSNMTFSLETAIGVASKLDKDRESDLDFCLNILVLGKTGVGKSATINSIFGEEKAKVDAFEPTTSDIKEIFGTINGLKVRILDTPGLRSPAIEQAVNQKILASIKKFLKKFPPDVVLYVDRLDTPCKNLGDLPLIRLITTYLSPLIWKNAIITLTHAASIPPDGVSGSTLGCYEFVAQFFRNIKVCISQAVGDICMMDLNSLNQVFLLENGPLCENQGEERLLCLKFRWRSQLLLLCYSLKILSEASLVSKPQNPSRYSKLFGFHHLSPSSLTNKLSSLSQSITDTKLSDTNGWNYDFGSHGEILERNFYVISQFPNDLDVQITRAKDEFSVHLISPIVEKRRENGSTVIDTQPLFSVRHSQNVGIYIGLNNKGSWRIILRTKDSEQLHTALGCILPVVISIIRSIFYGFRAKNSL